MGDPNAIWAIFRYTYVNGYLTQVQIGDRYEFYVFCNVKSGIARFAPTSSATAFVAADAVTLDPEALSVEVESALKAVRRSATPETTWMAYFKALRYFTAWHQLRTGRTLNFPVDVSTVCLFVIDHFGTPTRVGAGTTAALEVAFTMPAPIDHALIRAGLKVAAGRVRMATIEQRLSALAWAHREQDLESPTQDTKVRKLVADCRKLARELGEAPRPKAAATVDRLDDMLATCDDQLEGLRDRALLLFGWATGGRRRSEIAQAEVRDLEWLNDQSALFVMRRSKTSDTSSKPLSGDAAIAVKAWLDAAGIRDGALFRRVWRNCTVGGALSPHAINEIVKRRAQRASLVGDFAGHSLRRGFVTEAGRQGASLSDTMALSGHRQVKSVLRYAEAGEALRNPAGRLRDRKS